MRCGKMIYVPSYLETIGLAVDGVSLILYMLFRKEKAQKKKEINLSRKTWGYIFIFISFSVLLFSRVFGYYPSYLEWGEAVVISVFLFMAGMKGVSS